MSNRPDLHTDKHDKWDQGGYCNNLVTDDDGTGTDCGYRNERPATAPTTAEIRNGYIGEPTHFMDAGVGEEFDRWLDVHDAEVRADQKIVTDEWANAAKELAHKAEVLTEALAAAQAVITEVDEYVDAIQKKADRVSLTRAINGIAKTLGRLPGDVLEDRDHLVAANAWDEGWASAGVIYPTNPPSKPTNPYRVSNEHGDGEMK